jgi:DNA-binding Lrp family transcriptional regulator
MASVEQEGIDAGIAKKLGVDEETVRTRINRLQRSGRFQGWQLILNLHLIGLELASVLLDVDDSATKKTVFAIMTDYENFPKYFPAVKSISNVRREGNTSSFEGENVLIWKN